MSETNWPKRNQNVCEALEAVGIDPKTVLEDGITVDGFKSFVFFEGRKVTDASGETLTRDISWLDYPLDSAVQVITGYLRDRRDLYNAN